MTLMELLVALTIFALLSASALTHLGPWVAHGRARIDEARFWRAAAPAQLLLSELAAGAIADDARKMGSDRVVFRTHAPRLAATPVDVTLSIERSDDASRLLMLAPALSTTPSVIFEQTPPLRFAEARDRLQLEVRRGEEWAPVIVAPFTANAPFTCSFDAIARQCR